MMRLVFFSFLTVGVWACQNTASTDLKPLNLLSDGLPIIIQAPDSAKVVSGVLGVSQDVTVKSPADNFDVQIFASDAITTDLSAVKASHLAEVKSGPYFSKIIEEEPAGFIYETKFDSTTLNYGFRHLKIQGDKEYVFQTGLVGNFSLDDVRMMYEAVKNEP